MSERVRHSTTAALVMSKRLIVAACAAIAMVLGALSGGASFFTPGGRTNAPQANLGLATGVNNQNPSSTTTPSATNNDLHREHTLETIQLQGGAYNGSSISIPVSSYIGKVSASASLQGPTLSVNAKVSTIVPSVSIDTGVTTGGIGLSASASQPVTSGSSATGNQTGSTQNPSSTPSNTDTSSGTGANTSDPSQPSTSQPDTQVTPDPSSPPPTTTP